MLERNWSMREAAPLLGVSERQGWRLLAAYRKEGARGLAHKKDDQCFVEQKNGSIVRHLVGYDRFEGEAAYRQLAQLALWLNEQGLRTRNTRKLPGLMAYLPPGPGYLRLLQ